MIKRGDIYKVDLGLVNLFKCNQKGLHYVVVISNDKNNRYNSFVDVVPFTSRGKKKYLPTHVTCEILDDGESGQFLGEMIQPIDKDILTNVEKAEYIGHIENNVLLDKFVNAIINQIS